MSDEAAIYIFAGNLQQAERCATHNGYSGPEWIYIGTPVDRYIQQGRKRDIYFVGSYADRRDKEEAVRLAQKAGWTCHIGYSPPRNPRA